MSELPTFYRPDKTEIPALIYGRSEPARVGTPPNLNLPSFIPNPLLGIPISEREQARSGHAQDELFNLEGSRPELAGDGYGMRVAGQIYLEFESDINAGRSTGFYYPVWFVRCLKWQLDEKNGERRLEWEDRALAVIGEERGVFHDHKLQGNDVFRAAIDLGRRVPGSNKIVWSVPRGTMQAPKHFSPRCFAGYGSDVLDSSNPWAGPDFLGLLELTQGDISCEDRGERSVREANYEQRARQYLQRATQYCIENPAKE